MILNLKNIVSVIQAKWSGNHSETTIENISIDSRSLQNGSNTLFFALVGPNNDGHDYISALIEESSSVRQECNMMVRERCRVHGTMHVWECEVENNGGRKKANTRFFISQSRARPVHVLEHEECNMIVRERSLAQETMHAGEYEGEKNGGRKEVNIVSTRHFSSQSPKYSKWRSPVPADTKSESRTRTKCTGGEVNVGSAPVLLHSNGLVAKHSRYAIDVRYK